MKFIEICFLIILIILSLSEHVQGKSVINDFPSTFEVHSTGKSLDSRFLYLNNKRNSPSAEELNPIDITKSYEDVNGINYFLSPLTSDSIGKRNFVYRKQSNIEDLSKKPLKAAKFPDLEDLSSKTHNSQKVFCRQIMKSELNTEGNIIDSVRHICDPLPLQTTSIKTSFKQKLKSNFPYSHKEKRFERLVTSPPTRGYNCRRLMNSELNERGEIVDSVTELCDPPTTTTTTTRKPRLTTTTKATTTTPKPLVKICRPVMNSYLSEKGEIIDSVTMVCKMEKLD